MEHYLRQPILRHENTHTTALFFVGYRDKSESKCHLLKMTRNIIYTPRELNHK